MFQNNENAIWIEKNITEPGGGQFSFGRRNRSPLFVTKHRLGPHLDGGICVQYKHLVIKV